MANKKFYMGERHNPQFKQPYYVVYGQLTKKEAKAKGNCAYGSMNVLEYDTQADLDAAILQREFDGFRVSYSAGYSKIAA